MEAVSYLEKYYPYALEIEKQTGVPALVALAQSALESGYATAKPGNMMFGVKADKSWKGKKQLLRTREILSTGDKQHLFPEVISITKIATGKHAGKFEYVVRDYFRAYDSPLESFRDYAKFLTSNQRYKKAFQTSDPLAFAKEIALAGYATDPEYFNKLRKLITGFLEKKK